MLWIKNQFVQELVHLQTQNFQWEYSESTESHHQFDLASEEKSSQIWTWLRKKSKEQWISLVSWFRTKKIISRLHFSFSQHNVFQMYQQEMQNCEPAVHHHYSQVACRTWNNSKQVVEFEDHKQDKRFAWFRKTTCRFYSQSTDKFPEDHTHHPHKTLCC